MSRGAGRFWDSLDVDAGRPQKQHSGQNSREGETQPQLNPGILADEFGDFDCNLEDRSGPDGEEKNRKDGRGRVTADPGTEDSRHPCLACRPFRRGGNRGSAWNGDVCCRL